MTGGQAVDMPTSTTFELPGYTVERTLGLSWGLNTAAPRQSLIPLSR